MNALPAFPIISSGNYVMMETNQQDVAQAASAVLAKSSVRDLRGLHVDEHANRLELTRQRSQLLPQATGSRDRAIGRLRHAGREPG